MSVERQGTQPKLPTGWRPGVLMENLPRPARRVRWLYELPFSVYCALLIVLRESLGEGSASLRILEAPLRFLDRALGGSLHFWTNSSHDVFRLEVASWWFLAVIIFACLHIAGRIGLIRTFVCHVVGVVSVAGPLSCRYYMTFERYRATAGWAWLEVTVMAACVLLYLYQRWPANAALTILVLVLHFGFWALVIWGWDAWRDYYWQLGINLSLPLCSILAWGYYLKLSAGSRAPAEPPHRSMTVPGDPV